MTQRDSGRRCLKALVFTLAVVLWATASRASEAELDAVRDRAAQCAAVLQEWYVADRGVWDSTSWWNAANALTTLVHYTRLTGDETHLGVVANTFDRCKEFVVDDDPDNVWVCRDFINDWHDDAGWWVIAWIDAYDLTGDERYLGMAGKTFADMTTGWDDKCGAASIGRSRTSASTRSPTACL